MKRHRVTSPTSSRTSDNEEDSRSARKRGRKGPCRDEDADLRQAVRSLQRAAERLGRRVEDHREKRCSGKRHRTPSPRNRTPSPPRYRQQRRVDAPMPSAGDASWTKPSRLRRSDMKGVSASIQAPDITSANPRLDKAWRSQRTNLLAMFPAIGCIQNKIYSPPTA